MGFAVDVGVTSVNSKGSKSVTLRQQRIFIQGSDNCMCCGGSPGKSCSGRDGGPTPEGSLSSNTPSCLYVELSTYTRLLTRACIMGGNGLPCHPDLHCGYIYSILDILALQVYLVDYIIPMILQIVQPHFACLFYSIIFFNRSCFHSPKNRPNWF